MIKPLLSITTTASGALSKIAWIWDSLFRRASSDFFLSRSLLLSKEALYQVIAAKTMITLKT
ncbi:MAG: hypothetical protein ACXWV2_12140 [Chitinophagaceae bacterium]